MKYIVSLALVSLVGCGSQTVLHPNISHPARDLATTPHVEFMGDSQIMAVVAYANNPMWKCTTCVADQLSAAVLSEVPSVIALHPDLVVVQTGSRDIVDDIETSRTEPTSGNILAIQDAFEAAGIPVAIANLPESSAYDPYYLDDGLEILSEAGVVVNFFSYNSTSEDLTAGIDYSQAGLAEVYPAFYQEVESFGLGGTK